MLGPDCDTRETPKKREALHRMKRARAAEDTPAAGSNEDERFPWEKEPSRYIDGALAVKLKFVASLDDAAQVSALPSYSAEYVHQIFEPQGAIECPEPERPLELTIVYSAATLDVCHKLDPVSASTGVADAVMRLAAALPSPAEESYSDLVPTPGFSPAGKLAGDQISSYTMPRAGPGSTFEVYLAQLGPKAPAERLRFAERLQTVFRFCIETSESIDTSDEHWDLVTIFERKDAADGGAGSDDRVMSPTPPSYSLIAACTLYRFQRWVAGHGPVPLIRLCQAASLPPYRGQGHGSRLLQAVYTIAKERVDAREVTVEDPNEGFRLLRDRVDYRNCIAAGLMAPTATDGVAPPAELLSIARSALRITEDQLTRCYELQQYAKIGKQAVGTEGAKAWRLCIKRRLLKLHQEELDAVLSVKVKAEKDAAKKGSGGGAGGTSDAADDDGPSKENLVAARKARLEELFQELLVEYDQVLEKL